jgi:hypothetical protein
MDESPQPDASELSRGHSLGALFLLTAVCAVFSAMYSSINRLLADGEVQLTWMVVSQLAGATIAVLIGIVVGLHHHRRAVGCLIGGLAGLIVGLATGPLVLLPVQESGRAFAMGVAGAVLIVLVSLFIRWMNRRQVAGRRPRE